MARITWQELAVPRLDIQGLSMAADGVGRSFDRLGDLLINQRKSNITEATDDAIAQLMSLQDPEAVKAAMAGGPAGLGKNVNARALLEAGNQFTNQLLERKGVEQQNWLNEDQISDKKADTAFGELLPKFIASKYGNTPEAAAMMESLSGEEGFNRFMRLHGAEFQQAYQDGVEARRLQTSDDRTHSRGVAEIGIRQQQVDLDKRQDARQQTEFDRQTELYNRTEQERKDKLRGAEIGKRFLDNLPAKFSGDAEAALVKTGLWERSTPAQREGLLAGLGARDSQLYGEKSDTVGAQVARAGVAATSGAAQGNAEMVTNIARDQILRNNPGAFIAEAAQDKKYDGITNEQVRKAYTERTGIMNADQFVQDMKDRGFTEREMMATLDNTDMTDRGFNPTWNSPWFLGGFDFTSGTKRGKEAFDALGNLQQQGDRAKTKQSLATDASLARAATLDAQRARLAEQARRESIKTGKVSPETKKAIDANAAQLEALYKTSLEITER